MRATILTMTVLLTSCAEGPLWEKLGTDTKAHLTSVHGVSATDVWAVGNDGTALHFDGTMWAKQPTGTSNDLNDVWASSTNDVWMVGGSKTVLRWNGATISPVPNAPQSFDDVMGLDANTVFFCSFYGLFVFSDNAFTELKKNGLTARCNELFPLEGGVGALVENEVYRLTKSGSSLLFTLPNSSSQRSVAVLSVGDIWVIGASSGSVLRYGSGAELELVMPSGMTATGALVRSPVDAWVFGTSGYLAHFGRSALTLKVAGESSAPDLSSMWSASGVTFAVGTNGWAMRLIDE